MTFAYHRSPKIATNSHPPRHRQWVLQQARNQVIESFNQLKAARLQAHIRYLQTLPCFTLYQKYDNPPLTPPQLATLQHQMAQAKSIFQGGIDEDWRRCLQKYPEVLDYYFSLVQIDFPSAEDLVLREPRFGEHMRDPKRLKARRGSMDADAGHKKKSGRRRSRGRTPPAAPMAGHYRR